MKCENKKEIYNPEYEMCLPDGQGNQFILSKPTTLKSNGDKLDMNINFKYYLGDNCQGTTTMDLDIPVGQCLPDKVKGEYKSWFYTIDENMRLILAEYSDTLCLTLKNTYYPEYETCFPMPDGYEGYGYFSKPISKYSTKTNNNKPKEMTVHIKAYSGTKCQGQTILDEDIISEQCLPDHGKSWLFSINNNELSVTEYYDTQCSNKQLSMNPE